MKPNTVKKPVDKKLQQFIDAINDLQLKHEYRLVPHLQFTADGVIPIIDVAKVKPEDKEKLK